MARERNQFINPSVFDPHYLITRLRRDDLHVLIEHYLPKGCGAVVLDFGADKAPYKPLFAERVNKFLMADLVDDWQSSQFDVVIGPDGRLQQPFESVDVVLSLQVLEHVEDVDVYLSEANRVLKPGGLLWLTTHGMWPYHPTPTDYYRWTLPGLCKSVEPWFTVIDTTAMMGGPAYAIMIYMHILWAATRALNRLQAKLLNAVTHSQRWGKVGDRQTRIKNPYLYVGNILFKTFAGPLNLLMSAIDRLTPDAMKRNQAAVFRVTARKGR